MKEKVFCKQISNARSRKTGAFPFLEVIIFLSIAFLLLGEYEVGVKITGGIFFGLSLGITLSYFKTYKKGVKYWKRLEKYVDWEKVDRIANGTDESHVKRKDHE